MTLTISIAIFVIIAIVIVNIAAIAIGSNLRKIRDKRDNYLCSNDDECSE